MLYMVYLLHNHLKCNIVTFGIPKFMKIYFNMYFLFCFHLNYPISDNFITWFQKYFFYYTFEIWNDRRIYIYYLVDVVALCKNTFQLEKILTNNHYELQQNSTPRFPPEGFQIFCIQFFAFSRYFGSI